MSQEAGGVTSVPVDAAPAPLTVASIASQRHSMFVDSELGPECPLYLDYNASTPIAEEVKASMVRFGLTLPCNPSSSHVFGRRAREVVARAREDVASAVGASSPDCVVFVSCGTEASNWAITGCVRAWAEAERAAGGSRRPHVVTLSVEHPATMQTCCLLEKDKSLGPGLGIDLTVVEVNTECVASAADVAAAVCDRTCLVTVMLANNEIGSLMPVQEISDALDARCAELGLMRAGGGGRGVALHVDASQAVGKVPVDVAALRCDYLTIAGHKLYAPPGCGALVVAEDAVWGVPPPMVVGAPQEGGKRAGTVSVAMSTALGTACRLAKRFLEEDGGREMLWELRSLLLERLVAECAALGVPVPRFNGPSEFAGVLPNTLSLSFDGICATTLLEGLDGSIAASRGSACASISGKMTGVAKSIGLTPSLAMGTIRLSLGKFTTRAEVNLAASLLARGAASLLQPAQEQDDISKSEEGHAAAEASSASSASSASPAASSLPSLASSSSPLPRVLYTEPLYFQSTTLTACTGTVLLAAHVEDGADAKTMKLGVPGSGDVSLRRIQGCEAVVVLDRTVTHPQGGGQPSDKGHVSWLEHGAVHQRPIVHVCKGPRDSALAECVLICLGEGDKDLPVPGSRALASVDGAWREQCARLHSAGHLLDAAMRDLVPHLKPGTGYHFPDRPSVQYDGKLPAEEAAALIPKLQEACDALIEADAPTMVSVFAAGDATAAKAAGASDEDVGGYPEGATVRIVAVGDRDNTCPCGGTHVESAGTLRGLVIKGIKSKKGSTKVSYDFR